MSSSSDDGSSRSHALVAELYELNKKNKKLVHPSDQHPPNAPDVRITSWKMSEFRYYDIPSPFPTLARGLFTQKVDGQFKITVRGYDKFFNIGEVPWNTVSCFVSMWA
jgi:tRNA ligase